MSTKYVYLFSEGNASMKNLLGGKGANLAEMTHIGMPVPQGFTISTEACTKYYEDGEKISPAIEAEIFENLEKMQTLVGKRFGDAENPLLVSVRSGARASMPGMMDTILNLGINDVVAARMAEKSQNPRWAYDSYRRFIVMFADVAMGYERKKFDAVMNELKKERGVTGDNELTADDMVELSNRFKALYKEISGTDFPQEPEVQLMAAIRAVFGSWMNERAIIYRRLNNIPSSWGTAVNVQMMVFGNMGEDCGTGVAFSRDPANGENKLYGEYLMNAQGEDVVAGIRTPESIEQLKFKNSEAYEQFAEAAKKLERHYQDVQDMEFTIEQGKLYMLQTRNGKRTAHAALKIAVDLVAEGITSREEALLKIDPNQLNTLLHPRFDEKALKETKPIANGLAASPGAACGAVYFTAAEAKAGAEKGPVILVRNETNPEDIEGMVAARGILTATGGRTSHAAVVARGMGTCCVAGCGALRIHEDAKYFTVDDVRINEGDTISLDGSTGNVYVGALPLVDATVSGDFATVMGWADEIRCMKVRTNADTPRDAKNAINLGAEGIGLTRTEHMFFEVDRIPAMREMILSDTLEQRRRALAKLLPMQRGDFEGIFEVMGERPVTIRLLDPPLHEFLPTEEKDIRALAEDMEIDFEALKGTIRSMHEANPMMGFRGCRLPVKYPEIAEMQTRAIIEAAINVKKNFGYNLVPEIMIPLTCEFKELKYVSDIVRETADLVIKESGISLDYLVGTMIEIPRAALTADTIAEDAEFFSFGTNDLTQMTFGFSRDDAAKFLPSYYDKNLLENDPFERLDQVGVGKLVEMSCVLGRKTRPDLHLGICGEHGGEPSSVEFCHRCGLDYVSCSPFRVPIARLAAAQAQIKTPREKHHA
ncbi:MAG: pyruvate, phosphate dikinase [Ruminococcaceae bacterium]|nr:pyruvate, phosphate dikinase [Oscillospiraceae bacterium]